MFQYMVSKYCTFVVRRLYENEKDMNDNDIGRELITSFHTQSTQNQNHHQLLFLQVLTVLLTVLIGFGYLYIRVDVNEAGVKVTSETIYGLLLGP